MHRRTLLSSAVLFCFSLFLASEAFAQIPQPSDTTSVPIAGAGHNYLEGPVDTVNPANGSFSVRIPAIMPPSRGITLPFSFMYDSTLYYLSGSFTGYAQWSKIGSNGFTSYSSVASSGWSFGEPVVSATVARWVEIDPILGTRINCVYAFGYVFQDATGARHNLNVTNFYNDPRSDCYSDVSGTAPAGFDGQVILQGSEGSIMGTIPAAWNQDANVTVSDADGTVFTFSGTLLGCKAPCSTQFYSYLTSATDRNGNIIAITNPVYPSTITSYEDTSGRSVLQDSGFPISPETVTVSGLGAPYTLNWTTQPNPNFYSSIQFQSLNGTTCSGTGAPLTGSGPSVSSIALPNGESYTFAYDPRFGLVNKITYPTGGYTSYVWGQNPLSHYGAFTNTVTFTTCQMHYSIPAITDRSVSFDGSTEALHQTFSYSTTWSSSDPSTWTSKTTTVTTTDRVRNTTFTTVYTYAPIPLPGVPSSPMNWQDPHPANPVEVTVVYKDTNGSLLKTVTKTWRNERLLLSQTNTYPTGPANETVWNYDSNEMQIEKDDYDFGASGVGSLLRKTVTTYATSSAFTTNHILDKPAKIQVYDSTGTTLAAETDYVYDTPAATATSGIVQHSGGCKCGNLTSLSRWVNSSGSMLTSTFTNDDTGQRLSVTDPRGNATSYSYTDSYSSGAPPGPTNAYVTTVTHPVTSGVNHSEQYAYAYASGDVTSSTDQNNRVATYKYVDTLGRLTETDLPDGGQTTIAYNDAAYNPSTPSPSVTATKAITSGLSEVSATAFDGLGHTVKTILSSDPDGTTYTAITYNGTSSPYQVYNPTRCNPPTTNCGTETSWGYTTTTYDALGRTTRVAEPDGSAVSTTYSGNQTTVTDEAGNQRKSQTDGLGRLTYVLEAPNVGNGLLTAYSYDPLNDLIAVTQNGNNSSQARKRSFTYDSLGRLLCAANPEIQIVTCPASATGTFPTGAITYNYDANSNLASKTAPSPNQASTGTGTVTTTYTYDTLNRLTGKSYSDTYAQNALTPPVTFGYDGANLSCPTPIGFANGGAATNVIGRRTAMCYSAGNASWTYDPMGRIFNTDTRFIGLVPPYNSGPNNSGPVVTINGVPTISTNTNYRYHLNGDLQNVFYPQPGIANYEFYTDESSAGRVQWVGDTKYNVMWPATYAPDGQLATVVVGWSDGTPPYNGTLISNTYNNRLQPAQMSATTPSGSSVLNLTYNFNLGNGTTGSDNGNVIQIVNGKDSKRTQNFLYDPLNRIQQAYTSGPNWGETYSPSATAPGVTPSTPGIDAWGNLTNRSGVTGKTNSESSLNCAPANTQNQLNTCFTYDAAGNLIQNGTATYTYDAENRLIAAGGFSYIYDGDGERIEKCTQGATPGACASNATGTFYWKHIGGGTLVESDLGGNWTEVYGLVHGQIVSRVDLPAQNVHYYFHDHLQSTSIVTDCCGNIQTESDYYPYGGEIAIVTGDSNRYKFTGKERDTESGLDMFGARYYISSLGRFMKPDEPFADQDETDPQSWNLYSYVRNNPLRYTDPTGNACVQGSDGKYVDDDSRGETCAQVDASNQNAEPGVTVTATAPPVPNVAMAAGAATLELGWEGGPPSWAVGLGLLGLGCVQTQCWTPIINLFSQTGNNSPPPASSPSTSQTATPNPDPAGTNRRMTNKKAKEQAKKLGYDKEVQEPNFNSHGNKVFTNGKNFITADRDMHSGGAWKMFDSSGNRLGTYDISLNRIGN